MISWFIRSKYPFANLLIMAKSILIVDDCKTTRKIIALYLKDAGYKTIMAANGVEAIEKLISEKIDFIVSDLNMPQMDRIELIKWIRSNATFKNVPLIILSTEQDDLSRINGINTGASAFLTKPITKEHLVNEVRNIFDNEKEG